MRKVTLLIVGVALILGGVGVYYWLNFATIQVDLRLHHQINFASLFGVSVSAIAAIVLGIIIIVQDIIGGVND